MTKPIFTYGELVDITITGARVINAANRGLLLDLPGDSRGISLPLDADGSLPAGITAVVTCPADGPAQPGDVWKDKDGQRWFGIQSPKDDDEVLLSDGYDRHHLVYVCEHYAPLTLVHRELPVFDLGELDGVKNEAAALMADATQQLRASTDAPSFLAGVNALVDASQAAADAEAGA